MTNRPNTTFRPSMNWVHTWAGVLLGALLFIVFWMGTLAVFDEEIDRWMMPQTRLDRPAAEVNYDRVFEAAKAAVPGKVLKDLGIQAPSERKPFVTAYAAYDGGKRRTLMIDPADGRLLAEPQSLGGSGFLYPMHINLIIPGVWGWWIVMFAAIAMMLLLVTGVIIHRKIFTDFFTFRPDKKLRRSSLDLHNLTGTIFLPFHFLITFSGLMIFSGWYTSIPWYVAPDGVGQPVAELLYEADKYGHFHRDATRQPGAVVSPGGLIARAEEIWSRRHGAPTPPGYIDISHIGDAAGFVSVRGAAPGRMAAGADEIVFDLATGKLLEDYVPSPTRTVQKWLEGFHMVRFDHWAVRWLYFIGGLSGCMMIATSFIFWTASRRKHNSDRQAPKVHVVDALTVASVTGVIGATCAFFVANRLLPQGATWQGFERPVLEVLVFFGAWLAAIVHAIVRRARAWREQAWMIAVLAGAAVALNWATTGDNLYVSMTRRLWAVAGMDLVMLTGALVAGFSAYRLGRRAPASVASTSSAEAQ